MRLIDVNTLMEAINTWPKFGVDERGRIVPWNEGYEPYIRLRDVVVAITGIPTIEPERKKGTWITQQFGSWAECSVCHELYDIPISISNFCPNCGADMRGEEDG